MNEENSQLQTGSQLQTEIPQPWTYRKVLDLYKKNQKRGLVSAETALPDFAKELNQLSGSETFNAGLNDSKIKRISVGIDKGLEATGIPDVSADFFAGVGKLISPEAEKTGRVIGQDFLRGAIDSTLVLGGMAASATGLGASVGVPLMAVGGASTFSKTYAETDSPVAGLINTAATFALPGFMKGGAKLLAPLSKSVGATTAETVINGAKVAFPASKPGLGVAERAIDFIGLNLGAAANQELAMQSSAIAVGGKPFNPLKKEHIFELAVGNIPFLPFQARDIIKGPGKGEFRSFGEVARARDAEQILSKAYMETAERKHLYTSEKGEVKATDESVYAGGEMPRFTELGERPTGISPSEVIAAGKSVKPKAGKTLLGKPLKQLELGLPEEVPMLSSMGNAEFIAKMGPKDFTDFRRRLGPQTEIYQRSMGEEVGLSKLEDFARQTEESASKLPNTPEGLNDRMAMGVKAQFFREAIAKEKARLGDDIEIADMLLTAQEVVVKPIRTAADIEAVAKLTNDVAKANGEPEPKVTDEVLVQKVEQGIDNGLSTHEAVVRTGQAVQNRLNRTAAILQTKITKAKETSQQAQVDFTTLPENVQKVVGDTITKLSKELADKIDTDLSDAWTQAAVKWAKDPKNQELVNAKDTSAATTALSKVLGGVARFKTLERTRDKTQVTGGAETIFSEEIGGTLKPEVERLSQNGRETFSDIVKTENDVISEKQDALTQDVTLEEVKKFKPKADQKYVDRLSKVVSEFAQGNIERVYDKGKWKFTYHNIEELKATFGNVSNKTIMDFVKDNHGVVGKVIQERLGVKLMSFENKAGGFVLSVDPRLKSEAGSPGTFPIATKAWFTHHFLNKGVSPTEAARLSDITMKIASAYREIHPTRITALVGEGFHGMAIQLGKTQHGAIGINEAAAVGKFHGSGAVESFLKMHVLAHESFHSLFYAFQQGALDDRKSKVMAAVHEAVSQMTEFDKRFILTDAYKAVVPRQLMDNPEVKTLIDNLIKNGTTTTDEFLATYSGITLLGLANPSNVKNNYAGIREHLLFGDKHLTDFMNQQFVDLIDISDAYKDFLILDENVPKHEADLMHGFNQAFKILAQTKEEIAEAVQRLQFMDTMMDGGLTSLVKDDQLNPLVATDVLTQFMGDDMFAAKANFQDAETRGLAKTYMGMLRKEKPTSKDLLGTNLNWYERNLVPAAQIAEKYPIARPIITLGFQFRSMANKFATIALTPFGTPNKKGQLVFDPEHGGLSRTLHDEQLNEAFSHVALEQNLASKSLTDAEVDAIAAKNGLSPEKTEILQQVVKNTRLSMESMGQSLIRSRKDLIGIMAGRILLSRNKGLNAQQAHQLGNQVTDALIAASGQDPAAAAQGAAALQQVQQLINNPEAFAVVTQAITGILPKYQDFANQIANKPWYTPEVRLGKFFLRWTKNGEKNFVGLKTKAEFDEKLAKLNSDETVDADSVKGFEKFDQNNNTQLLASDMVQKFAAIEQNAFDTMKAMFPEDAAVIDKLGYQPGEAAFKEVTAQGIGKYSIKRKLVAGREDINMMEGVLDYVTGVSTGVAKGYTRSLASLYLADPTLQTNPKVQAFLRDHIQSVTSSPKEYNTIKNVVFHFTLGGNLSSLLVERLQPLFTLVPHLTQHGAGIAGGYKYVGRAMQALSQIAGKGVSKLDPALRLPEMLKRASDERLIDFGVYEELVSTEELGITNLRNVATSNPQINSVAGLLSKPLFWYTRFARNLYTKASSQNTRIAFIASYLLAMEKGVNGKKVSPDEAYQFAYDSTHTTMFGGGRAARPVGLFANLGKSYGAVSAWYMLQHYSTSSIAMMYRLLSDSLGKSGLTPYQTSLSRKALGQMVMTQTMMAGTLGLPLVGGTLAVLEQIFPDLEAKKAIRETLAGLAGDDKEMGELISDSFLHGGLPRAIGLGMVDVSGRFGLGNVFGIDPDYGFQPEAVFGAPGSVFGNMLRAGGKATQGQIGEAVEQGVPAGFRNLVKMYNDDWNVRDAGGRLIFEPNETETLLGAIGFRPKRLSQFREQQHLLKRSDDIASREIQKFHSDLATLLLSGDTGQVRSLLLARSQEDPLYDPRAGLRRVVQAAQDRSVPVDVNRGSRASLNQREDVSQTFTPGEGRPSETQLLMKRKQMERSVGVAGAGSLSRHEMSIAQMVDRLLSAHPGMGRQKARALVERQLAQARPPRF